MKTSSRIYHTSRKKLPLGKRTYLMGILNLTPDSFSDGGEFFDHDVAAEKFYRMVEDGAQIIDIGGESTRPGHVPILADEEIERVVPFIKNPAFFTIPLVSVLFISPVEFAAPAPKTLI